MLNFDDVNVGDIIIFDKTWKPTPVIGKGGTGSVLVNASAQSNGIGFLVDEKTVVLMSNDYDIDISMYIGERLTWIDLKYYLNAALIPKEDLKENKQTKTVSNSFYEICLQEAKQKIKKENEQRPINSAFEFL